MPACSLFSYSDIYFCLNFKCADNDCIYNILSECQIFDYYGKSPDCCYCSNCVNNKEVYF